MVVFSNFTIPTAAYIHLPFCRRRCFYCDFAVFPLGDRLSGEHSGTVEQYLDYLKREIAIAPQFHPFLTEKNAAQDSPIIGKSSQNYRIFPGSIQNRLSSVFIGGGTPSLLSATQIEGILQAINDRLGIAQDAEISLEIDPGTFDKRKLADYRALEINRFSMGVQAFQDELLKLCGRSHTVAEIWESVRLIQQVGIENWSLDLISGLPTQSLEQWQYSLEKAVEIAPNHVSTYDLIVEPSTVFARYYQPNVAPLPDDTTTAKMYQLAQEILTSQSYQHYEISNYAQIGYQCQHNRIYWENRPYYGFGMGAASYINQQRFTRPRKTREYYEWVDNLVIKQGLIDFPSVSPAESLLDRIMLGLRLAEGVNLAEIASEFGKDTVEAIAISVAPYVKQGWVSISSVGNTGDRLQLTDPQGFLFSNTILAHIFAQLDEQ
jgi:oxygen-independent coproporphyrinogen-3 oxidase